MEEAKRITVQGIDIESQTPQIRITFLATICAWWASIRCLDCPKGCGRETCWCLSVTFTALLQAAVLGTVVFGIYSIRYAMLDGKMAESAYEWAMFGILLFGIAIEVLLSFVYCCRCITRD